MSQPIITPRKFLQAIYGRDTLPPEVAGCTCAVIAFLCGQSCGGVVGGLYVCSVRWYRSSHLGRRQTGHSPREGVLQDLIVAMLSRILGQFSPGK